MGRVYQVPFENVAIAGATNDLVTIFGAAGKVLRINKHWFSATDTTLPTSQMLAFRGRVLPATVTAGSGGTTPTPAKTDQGNAAATFTAHANDTTKSTTSGTAVTVEEGGGHIYNPYEKVFAKEQPTVNPTGAYVFELLSTVSGTVHASGGVEVEEIG